jgi:hypothetical protein
VFARIPLTFVNICSRWCTSDLHRATNDIRRFFPPWQEAFLHGVEEIGVTFWHSGDDGLPHVGICWKPLACQVFLKRSKEMEITENVGMLVHKLLAISSFGISGRVFAVQNDVLAQQTGLFAMNVLPQPTLLHHNKQCNHCQTKPQEEHIFGPKRQFQ